MQWVSSAACLAKKDLFWPLVYWLLCLYSSESGNIKISPLASVRPLSPRASLPNPPTTQKIFDYEESPY